MDWKSKETYRVVNYFDIWGNAKEGWEVNNLCEHARGVKLANGSEETILKALKEAGFLAPHVRRNMLIIEWIGPERCEVSVRRDGMPLCALEEEFERVHIGEEASV